MKVTMGLEYNFPYSHGNVTFPPLSKGIKCTRTFFLKCKENALEYEDTTYQ